jgi:O-antigen/teichoic acid export membrane protein
VGRGVTSAIVAIVVPPVLIRHMQPSVYAVWVLVLQVVGYMGFIDFGLQTAVGRYVAFAEQKKDLEFRNSIFSTAFAGLSLAALIGLIAIAAISMKAGYIFPSIPRSLLKPMRIAMLVAGLSVAIGLPVSAWNGVFVGLQRYEIPASTLAMGKLLTSAGLILAALNGKSLIYMGGVVAAINFVTYTVQFGFLRCVVPQVRFRPKMISKTAIRELSQYCATLTIWSFSTFLIAGLDLILVGRFEFNAVTPYSTAAVLIAFFGGLQVSIFNVIMPHAASLFAAKQAKALGDLLLKTTRLGFLILLITGLPLIVCSFYIIKIWIGAQFAKQGSSILVILVLANMLRLISVPYSSILLGTGQQRLIIISPVMESIVNLMASVLLGMRYGAIGVAYGTLLGAFVGILFHLFYNLPRTKAYIDLSARSLIASLAGPAGVCLLPFLATVPFWYLEISNRMAILLAALSFSILFSFYLATKTFREKNEV